MADNEIDDVLGDGMDDACSDVFSTRDTAAWSPGVDLKVGDHKSFSKWVRTGHNKQKLVKRTSPR